jgi:hypothetical protein
VTAAGGAVIGEAIIAIIPDVRRFASELRNQLHSASRDLKRLQRDIKPADRLFRSLARNATGIAPGIALATAALATLGAQAISGGVLAVAGGLYELAGSALVIPAAAVAAGAAMGTLKVGLQGVSKAFKQFLKDPEKFREMASKLSANAKETLLTLDKLRPRILAFRNAVQDALFAGLGKVLLNLARSVLPIVQQNFVSLAHVFNAGAKDLAGFVQQASTLKDLKGISSNIVAGFKALRPAIKPAAQAILDLVAAGSQFLPQIGAEITKLTQKFANFIRQARTTGQLQQWIAAGLGVLAQLGRIIGNIIVGLHALLSAAKSAGLGLFDTFENASKAFRNFLTSVHGQNSVAAFLDQARQAAALLAPMIVLLGSAFFGHLVPALVAIGQTLGPGITAIFGKLGATIDALRPGVIAFADGFNTFLKALAPALPALGQLVGAIARLVGALSAGLGPALANVIMALTGILIPVLNALTIVIQHLPEGFFRFIIAIGLVGTAVVTIIGILRAFIAFATLFAGGLKIATIAVAGLTRASAAFSAFIKGPWGIAILAGIALLTAFALGHQDASDAENDLNRTAADLNQAIRDQNGLIDENIKKKAAQQLEDKGAFALATDLGISTADLTNAYVDQGSSLEDVKSKLEGMVAGQNIANATLNAGSDAHARQVVEAAKLLGIINQLTSGRAADTAAQNRVTGASNAATDAIERQRNAYYDLINAQQQKQNQDLADINSNIAYQRQLSATRQELATGTKTLNINTKEGQNNLSSVTALIDVGNRRIAQLKAEHAPINDINTAIRQQQSALIGLLTPYFKSAAAARAFAVQLGLIPKKTVAQIILEDKAARAAAESYRRVLDNLTRDRVINIRFNPIGNAAAAAGAPVGGHPFAATGGKFDVGDFAVVGEKGPELVAFGRAARVFSHEDSVAMTTSDKQLTQLNRLTGASGYEPTAPTTVSPSTTVHVKTAPEVHVYIGNRAVDEHVEKVTVARERQTKRIIRTKAPNVRGSLR